MIQRKKRELRALPSLEEESKEVDHMDKMLMEREMMMRLGCDETVAEYALLMTNYNSIQDATAFLFEFDDYGHMRHTYIGYRKKESYDSPSKLTDLEMQKSDTTSEKVTICFLCQDQQYLHINDEKEWFRLDQQESGMLDALSPYPAMNRRHSSFLQMRKQMSEVSNRVMICIDRIDSMCTSAEGEE